ncbi:MAG TPA: hypothetical protein VNF24_01840 [Candidatus Acidoferrales bacterium]|nr:hypothetical protein [Candidatus Acidoferrales bacterium]
MNRKWARLYPSAWRARYEEEMAEVLAEVPWRPRPAFDLIRSAADAWLNPPERDQPSSGAPWLASWATAAGLASLAFALFRTVAIPTLVPAGVFSWWWPPIVAKSLIGALGLLSGVWLAWHERWRAAAAALSLGTVVSSLALNWTIGPGTPSSSTQMVDLTTQPYPAWAWPAFDWPIQFLFSCLAVGTCLTAVVRASRRTRRSPAAAAAQR